jgi:hypothetical protein
VSIVGIYDYFSFGIGMEVESFGGTAYNYKVTRNSYQGTLVFDANGTVTINGTGGYTMMQIMNERSFLCGATSGCSTTDPRQYSLMSGTVNTIDPTDIGTTSYTVNGSTITAVGGFVGTLSADGKIFVGRSQSNATGIVIGIRRPPTITSATSTTADGHYNAGASINITLNFSEAVTSTGLTIALNSGATITTGALSNAPSWSGTYTVGTGQTSSDLSISTITGTITSVFSTSNPTIPAGKNIGDSKAIVIE